MPETNILESLTHLSEIITDAINGIFAFLVYWPFIWLFFHPELISKMSVLDAVRSSYVGLAEIVVHADILALPLIILVLPCIGLLNRAIVSTFIDILVVRCIFGYNILGKISVSIRKFTIWTLDKQLDRSIKDKELWKIDQSLYPCWRLEGSFDYVNYRHWLIKNPTRKSYWDWEHFLDWVYKSYYQTLIMFLIMYLGMFLMCSDTLNVEYLSIAGLKFDCVHLKGLLTNDLLVFILALPTYALYREYLKHHIAWIRMDQKFYVDYLIENGKGSGYPNLKKYSEEENYEKIEETLEEYFRCEQ